MTSVWWSIMFQELFSDHFSFLLSDGTNASINLQRCWHGPWSLHHSYSPFLPKTAYPRELDLPCFRRPSWPCVCIIFQGIQYCNDGIIVALLSRHLTISAFASICRFSFSFPDIRSSVLFSSTCAFFFYLYPPEWINHYKFLLCFPFQICPFCKGAFFLGVYTRTCRNRSSLWWLKQLNSSLVKVNGIDAFSFISLLTPFQC